MANPNLNNITDIRGNTAYIQPATTASGQTGWTHNGATSLVGLTPAVNSVNKIESIVATNFTGNNVNATVQIANNATFASGTSFPIAFNVTVPPNASLIITDKSTSFYVTENQSIGVTTSTASALCFVASFEVLT